MRYIKINNLKRPTGWDAKAQAAYEKIQDAQPEDRSKLIDRHSSVWSDIKDNLSELSYGKCWYCETRLDRSPGDVDHFRPKAKVTECPDHPGYWWLAFDWRNYRFSCVFCNRLNTDPDADKVGGKGNYFPLLDESTRAYAPTNDLSREKTCLLDPTNPADVMLLWFEQTGYVDLSPHYSHNDHETRVRESIRAYHLNHTVTQQARMVLHNEIEDTVKKLDRSVEDNNQTAMIEMFGKLSEYLSERAEYSAAARCYLLGFRSTTRPWIESLLQTH